jgi:hypothetical protein
MLLPHLNFQNIKKKILPNTSRENINKKGGMSTNAIFTAIKALDHSTIANIKYTQPFKLLRISLINFILVLIIIDEKLVPNQFFYFIHSLAEPLCTNFINDICSRRIYVKKILTVEVILYNL